MDRNQAESRSTQETKDCTSCIFAGNDGHVASAICCRVCQRNPEANINSCLYGDWHVADAEKWLAERASKYGQPICL